MARQSDAALKEKVQAALDTDKGMRGYGLKADVINGEVQLTGIVDTLSEKERLEQIVFAVEGVRGIENGVSISTDGAITDADVTAEVMEELDTDPQVDLKNVGAKSVKGTVFLQGRINDRAEEDAAVKAAAKARGVRDVVSQLEMETARELTLEEIFHSQVKNERKEKRKGL